MCVTFGVANDVPVQSFPIALTPFNVECNNSGAVTSFYFILICPFLETISPPPNSTTSGLI